jgi:hypothetical protein
LEINRSADIEERMKNQAALFHSSTVVPLTEAVIEEYAPEEFPIVSELLEVDLKAPHRIKDPLQFGVGEAFIFLTPYVAKAISEISPFILGVAYKSIEDVSKDMLKRRIKEWIDDFRSTRGSSNPPNFLQDHQNAVVIAQKCLEDGGVSTARAHELAIVITASLSLASILTGSNNEASKS